MTNVCITNINTAAKLKDKSEKKKILFFADLSITLKRCVYLLSVHAFNYVPREEKKESKQNKTEILSDTIYSYSTRKKAFSRYDVLLPLLSSSIDLYFWYILIKRNWFKVMQDSDNYNVCKELWKRRNHCEALYHRR